MQEKLDIRMSEFKYEYFYSDTLPVPTSILKQKPNISESELFKKLTSNIIELCDLFINKKMSTLCSSELSKDKIIEIIGNDRWENFRKAVYTELKYRLNNNWLPEFANKQKLTIPALPISDNARILESFSDLLCSEARAFLSIPSWEGYEFSETEFGLIVLTLTHQNQDIKDIKLIASEANELTKTFQKNLDKLASKTDTNATTIKEIKTAISKMKPSIPTNLENYYTKQQTNNLLNDKLNKADFDSLKHNVEKNTNSISSLGASGGSQGSTQLPTDNITASNLNKISREISNWIVTPSNNENNSILSFKTPTQIVAMYNDSSQFVLKNKTANKNIVSWNMDGVQFMNNDINAQSHTISNLKQPTRYSDAATKQYVDSKFSDISMPSLSNYYTKSEVTSLINSHQGQSVDLSDYYTKGEIRSYLSDKVSTSTFNTLKNSLGGKLDSSALNNYYTKSQSDARYAKKSDLSTSKPSLRIVEDNSYSGNSCSFSNTGTLMVIVLKVFKGSSLIASQQFWQTQEHDWDYKAQYAVPYKYEIHAAHSTTITRRGYLIVKVTDTRAEISDSSEGSAWQYDLTFEWKIGHLTI